MVEVRPIRTEADYETALARAADLMDARAQTPAGDELDILVALIERYEAKRFPIGFPDPVAAIEFHMDQTGMSPRDLVPYIGSRARVSEVLSRKRPITMAMARALHEHLAIPAEVLLQKPRASNAEALDVLDAERFPLREMAKRAWIPDIPNLKKHADELIQELLERAGGQAALAAVPLYRRSEQQRLNAKTDLYALQAWFWQVLACANDQPPEALYQPGVVSFEFLQRVARLSVHEDGPLRARRLLAEHGIALQIERHLPKTYLDGAALQLPDARPVIGLTLRYDRIDNFWFCLLHELAHLGRHLGDDHQSFVDDLDLPSGDTIENEADRWAQEALIPSDAWQESRVAQEPTSLNAIYLANQLGIHPAIVAGRLRYETRNYRLLSQLVGTGQVRKQFEREAHN